MSRRSTLDSWWDFDYPLRCASGLGENFCHSFMLKNRRIFLSRIRATKEKKLENENFNTILLREVQPPTVPIRSFPPRPEPDFPSEIVKEPALRLRENPLVEFS